MHVTHEVAGPWALDVCRAFWEGFAPGRLAEQHEDGTLRTVFLSTHDWTPVSAAVTQDGTAASITVSGPGDLERAAEQVVRFLALDVDAHGWIDIGERDPIIRAAQQRFPGLRPCGFHSPYEAAVWAVLSQRTRVPEAARLRRSLTEQHGDAGAFPAPEKLLGLDLDLPGRKAEYLHAVAGAALDGVFDGLRDTTAEDAIDRVRAVKGIGPFGAELIVLRGANHPDGAPRNEGRLAAEITTRYGAGATVDDVSPNWHPFRTWASFHLRATAG